ncbi:hypothetical protein TeGR_g10142, partial [Tetraparma gracilis]
MLPNFSPLSQALLGTSFGWFMTAAGASLVYPLELLGATPAAQRKFLDAALGASSGVMLAASYFSLLAPAIEEASNIWPGWEWLVASVGFLLGALVIELAGMYLDDDVVKSLGLSPPSPPSS